MTAFVMLAAVLFEFSKGGVEFKVESEASQIDPAKSVFLRLELKTPKGVEAAMPDLRERTVGFSLAEDFAEPVVAAPDGGTVQTVNWRLVPEPCAAVYKIKPFAVAGNVAGPVYFENPAPREAVTGDMEVDPKKDLPPLSWKLVGWIAAALAAIALAVASVWFLVRFLARKIKEHRMSPIERAWVELERLLGKGLPGRGRYKDFYVELTMVVRRYIQRKYGIKAPHMTTEEFLREAKPSDELRRFLESADMVKFAGVEATPEMADEATQSARDYLKQDDKNIQNRSGKDL
ncbi:MAG: hypothetical protein IIW14_07825 [Kiritimatiellae bacterium]|nr:hypothetical protein [Kiritimatiellia bacterium]